MDCSHSPEGLELPSQRVEVYRFSKRDEPDEPYVNYAEDGFLVFRDFIDDLRKKYPDKEFPSSDVLNRMRSSGSFTAGNLTTYIAESGNKLAGGIIGEDLGRRFKGNWYAIDPEYQRTEVTKGLLEAIKKQYDEVTLIASTFGYDKKKEMKDTKGDNRH